MECTVVVSAEMILGGRFLLQNVEGLCLDRPVRSRQLRQPGNGHVPARRRTVRRLISGREWVETAYETRNRRQHKVMEIRARRISEVAR